MKTKKLNIICVNYRKKKLGSKTKNGSIIFGIKFASEVEQTKRCKYE